MMNLNSESFNFLRARCKEYTGQVGQDLFLDVGIFNKMTNGFFVDIGANDGFTYSNTYFFEKYRNWTGLCVEPQGECFKLLKATRKESTIKVKACISEFNGVAEFLQVNGPQMLSCLKEYCTEEHSERIKREIEQNGGEISIIPTQNIKISDLFGMFDINKIDILSLDIEGGEYKVLQMIDYSKVHINAIVVEFNNNKNLIVELLQKQGFKLVANLSDQDLVFINNEIILL